MRSLKSLALIVAVATLGCGGGDGGSNNNGNPTTPPPGGATNGTFTAVVNGAAWSATGQVTVTRLQNNFIGVAGSGFAGSTAYAFVVGIANATGPGSHTLALGAGGDGSSVIVGGTTIGWGTAIQGGSGTITVTSLTANRIAGTFNGILVPSSGSGGNLTVTNGAFDITF
jgi:hypothetical protein